MKGKMSLGAIAMIAGAFFAFMLDQDRPPGTIPPGIGGPSDDWRDPRGGEPGRPRY